MAEIASKTGWTSVGNLADDAQNLRRGCLLLERLGQVAIPCLELLEQPNVLDRDDGLAGERLKERDLLGRERSTLPPADRDGADCDTLPQHRHAEDGTPERRDLGMLVLRIRSDVSLLDASRENSPAGEGASAGRPREEPLEGFAFQGTPPLWATM